MQEVDRLLKGGDHVAAEGILDTLLTKLGEPATGSESRSITAPRAAGQCDPLKPMVVTVSVTVTADCTIGGDLTVTGTAVLYFDYRQRSNGRVVINGNVVVQDDASLQVDGRPGGRAVLLIANAFRDQRTMTSRDRAKIKLNSVEFRTQQSATIQGSVSMPYDARGSSSLEVTGSTIVEAQSWLLANLYDSARLTVVDTQHVPNEIYVHDKAVATIRGSGTRTGVWLDAQGAQGTVTVPNVNGPFSWRIGAGNGLNVGWLLQVENAQPGLGLEIKPGTALTVVGNGTQAPATGELRDFVLRQFA